jgi:hypothetical protein
VRGLVEARALAEAAAYNEHAYLRAIFAPADSRRRTAPEEPESDEEHGGGEGAGDQEVLSIESSIRSAL